MAYRIEIAKSAELQLEELYLWVVDRAPTQGAAWFNGVERAILSSQLRKRVPSARTYIHCFVIGLRPSAFNR